MDLILEVKCVMVLCVQATHRNGRVLSFYTMPEYESWKESLGGNTSGWSIKYYKVCLIEL